MNRTTLSKLFSLLAIAIALFNCGITSHANDADKNSPINKNPLAALANISINSNYSPENLVNDILVENGACIQISNVSFSGNNNAIGYFSTGIMGTGLEDGIILATGNVNNAVGPNNSTETETIFPGNSSDDDLEEVADAPNESNDAAILEFDFIPSKNTVTLDFVFASEEYPEYVNNFVNDVFGIFVSGPGITGPYTNAAENVALLPGTNIPVSIDDVNATTNSAYYNNNANGQFLEYDAYLDVIQAEVAVVPCETYHIKIAISDIGDSYVDSAVFIGGNSFDASDDMLLLDNFVTTNAIEECAENGSFLFTRNDISDLSTPVVINFTINGTATNGTDYTAINSSITIPAGEESFELLINAINDGITEPLEDLTLTITNECICFPTETSINISDFLPLEITGDMMVGICTGETASIGIEVLSGNEPYEFDWTGLGAFLADSDTFNISPTNNQNYTVTVTDACLQSETFPISITVSACPCNGSSNTPGLIQN